MQQDNKLWCAGKYHHHIIRVGQKAIKGKISSVDGGSCSRDCVRETLLFRHTFLQSHLQTTPKPFQVISEVSEPYDNPFCGFEQRYVHEGYIPVHEGCIWRMKVIFQPPRPSKYVIVWGVG